MDELKERKGSVKMFNFFYLISSKREKKWSTKCYPY